MKEPDLGFLKTLACIYLSVKIPGRYLYQSPPFCLQEQVSFQALRKLMSDEQFKRWGGQNLIAALDEFDRARAVLEKLPEGAARVYPSTEAQRVLEAQRKLKKILEMKFKAEFYEKTTRNC
jgi:hypothetical protein